MHDATIEKVSNGYIIRTSPGYLQHNEKVFHKLEEVFEELLSHFEGRCKSFGGDSYGEIRIIREKESK
jgi:hypothetical protein